MFKIYLSRTVSPGVGISLPATIEEMREAYSLLNGTDTVPLETATTYVESSIPNLRQYLYEVPVSEKRLEELNYLAYRVKWMDSQDEAVFGTVIEMMKPETLQDIINLSCNMDKFRYLPSATTEVKLGEYLLKGNADMAMEEQAARSNYEGIGKDYIKNTVVCFMHLVIPAGFKKNWSPSIEGRSYQIRISNRLVVLKYGFIKGILMITIH